MLGVKLLGVERGSPLRGSWVGYPRPADAVVRQLGMLALGNNFGVWSFHGPARVPLDAPSRAGSDAAGSEHQRAAGSMHAAQEENTKSVPRLCATFRARWIELHIILSSL